MDEQINFDTWIQSLVPHDPEYYAIYDPETNIVIGIYPAGSAKDKPYKIKIDSIIAEEINLGKINLSSCVVDPFTTELNILNNSKYQNERYFHQIKSNVANLYLPTLNLKYLKDEKKLYFIASDSLREVKEKFSYITQFYFYITVKNDPDLLYQIIKLNHEEIFSKEFSLDLDIDIQKYSIFTKKIFKNYYLSIR